jgi:hypothetical protein
VVPAPAYDGTRVAARSRRSPVVDDQIARRRRRRYIAGL